MGLRFWLTSIPRAFPGPAVLPCGSLQGSWRFRGRRITFMCRSHSPLFHLAFETRYLLCLSRSISRHEGSALQQSLQTSRSPPAHGVLHSEAATSVPTWLAQGAPWASGRWMQKFAIWRRIHGARLFFCSRKTQIDFQISSNPSQMGRNFR